MHPSLFASLVATAVVLVGCSDNSNSPHDATGFAGRVTVSAADARIPAQRAVSEGGMRNALVVHARPHAVPRYDVTFHDGALPFSRAGLLASRSTLSAADANRSIRAMLEAHPMAGRFTVTNVSPVIATARIRITDRAHADEVLAALRADPRVESVSEDGVWSRLPIERRAVSRSLLAPSRGPSSVATPGAGDLRFSPDALSPVQYWHYNLIDAPRAWSVSTGSQSVVVAVIDEGINPHPDITANLDLAHAYDFVANDEGSIGTQQLCNGGSFTSFDDDGTLGPDNDPTMPTSVAFDDVIGCWVVLDGADHGLHVAGTIGAAASGAGNVNGVSWAVKIRPIRALGIDGAGYVFDIAQAILYAAGLPAEGANQAMVSAPNGAPIINMSLGGSGDSKPVRDAVAAALAAGSIIIAAAGNAATGQPFYPAAYPGVIAVAALGPDGNLASYSNAGPYVSLAAPGGDFRFDDFADPNPYTTGTGGVLSTTWDFNTGQPSLTFYSGTSMAAPHVSGVAALVLAANPGLTAAQLTQRLLDGAIDIGPPGVDARYGRGRVDAYNSVTNEHGAPAHIFVSAINSSTGAVVKTVQAQDNGIFALSGLPSGSYYVVAGQDENGDEVVGFPGRRFGWAGTGRPAVIELNDGHTLDASVSLGTPVYQAGDTPMPLFVNGWALGSVASASQVDTYELKIAAPGQYTVETSGAIGACGLALELNTLLTLLSEPGDNVVATNDNTSFFSGAGAMTFPATRCSKVTANLSAGTYRVQVGWGTAPFPNPGTYRVHVRPGA